MLIDIILGLLLACSIIIVCSEGPYFPLINLVGLALMAFLGTVIAEKRS